jgi:hypothetical protein
MPLPSSGQLSLADIYVEQNGTFPGTNANVSLTSMSEMYNADPCNPASVDGNPPHRVEEFFNYDHNCGGGGGCHLINLSGPFGEFPEACDIGPNEPCGDFHFEGDGDIGIGTQLYLGNPCTESLPGGNLWWYDCNRMEAYQVNDGGEIIGIAVCEGGGKK